MRTVSASGCMSCNTLKSGHCFHEPRVCGSRLLTVSVLLQKSFPVSDTGGVAGSRFLASAVMWDRCANMRESLQNPSDVGMGLSQSALLGAWARGVVQRSPIARQNGDHSEGADALWSFQFSREVSKQHTRCPPKRHLAAHRGSHG